MTTATYPRSQRIRVGRRAASYNHGLEAHTTVGRPHGHPGLSRDLCISIPTGVHSHTRKPEGITFGNRLARTRAPSPRTTYLLESPGTGRDLGRWEGDYAVVFPIPHRASKICRIGLSEVLSTSRGIATEPIQRAMVHSIETRHNQGERHDRFASHRSGRQ